MMRSCEFTGSFFLSEYNSLYFCTKSKNMLENKDQNKTSLAQLGEFGLIDHITKNFQIRQKSTLKGIGDDAAVLDFKSKKADRKSTRLNSSHVRISYAVFCL